MPKDIPVQKPQKDKVVAHIAEKSLEDETREDLASTYKSLFGLLCDGKINFSDIRLLDYRANEQNIFNPDIFSDFVDDQSDEFKKLDEGHFHAELAINRIKECLPEDLQPYAEAYWVKNMIGEAPNFRKGVLEYWVTQIEPQPGISTEETLGVLGAISFMELHAPQFNESEDPQYLYAGSLSLWMLKTAGPNLSSETSQDSDHYKLLNDWRRKIHDIDCCVNIEHQINFQALFSLSDIPFSENIFDTTEIDPRSPSLHAELRPTVSDTNDYVDINLGGYHIAVASPEYSLAFKRLQLLQDPDKNNAIEDMAVLQTLVTDMAKVERIYQENLPLLASSDN